MSQEIRVWLRKDIEVEFPEMIERWKRNYTRNGKWATYNNGYWEQGQPEEIYNRFLALGPTPTIEQIESVFTGWGYARCNECGEPQTQGIKVSEDVPYEQSSSFFCASCVEKVLNELKTATSEVVKANE